MLSLLSLSQSLGLPVDSIKSGILLFSNYAFLYPFKRIKSPVYRHVFSILLAGASYIIFFGLWGYSQLLILSLLSYVLSSVSAFHKTFAPMSVFVTSMGILLYNHFVAQLNQENEASVDHTAPMMVIVMKVTSFAWSIYDGQQLKRDPRVVIPSQKERAIHKMPSLLAFLGYIHFFPAFLVGPTFGFKDYNDFIHQRSPFNETEASSLGPALVCLAHAFVALAGELFLGSTYSYHRVIAPDFVANTSFFYRCFFIVVTGIISRCKFYTAWKLAEGACILSGIGYMGKRVPESDRWKRVENINMFDVESSENPRALLAHWNKNTANWLREDVYLRLTVAGFSQLTCTLLTSLTSAAWHGIHFGYYAGFFTLALLTTVARHIRRYVRPWFAQPQSYLSSLKPLYDLVGVWTTHLLSSYCMGVFFVRGYQESLAFYGAFFYAGHVLMLALVVGFSSLFPRWCRLVSRSLGIPPDAKKVD